MRLSHKENLTYDMRNRRMTRPAIVCKSSQSLEVEELHNDYNEFLELLAGQVDHDPVPLAEFARWRAEATEEAGYEPNAIPSIH